MGYASFFEDQLKRFEDDSFDRAIREHNDKSEHKIDARVIEEIKRGIAHICEYLRSLPLNGQSPLKMADLEQRNARLELELRETRQRRDMELEMTNAAGRTHKENMSLSKRVDALSFQHKQLQKDYSDILFGCQTALRSIQDLISKHGWHENAQKRAELRKVVEHTLRNLE